MSISNAVFCSASPAETRKIAKKLAGKLQTGEWLGLVGGLGAGKTTFMQGLAQGLRIKEPVQSPTFVLAREYSGIKKLVHIDLYRLAENEIGSIGLEDYCSNGWIVAVEWADKLPEVYKNGIIRIDFEVVDESRRKISIQRGAAGQKAVNSLNII